MGGHGQKWVDELSRLIEWFLPADSDGIISYSPIYLWHAGTRETSALVLSQSF